MQFYCFHTLIPRTAQPIPGFTILLLGWCLLSGLRPVQAQLISPGKLAEPHADLEGITNCTKCHELGQRSAADPLCLNCHTPLSDRIEAGRGYHSTITDQYCADCHKEHFGVDFILIRLDTVQFNHDDTGFELLGAHNETSCRSCHTPSNIIAADVRAFKEPHGALEKTFLGLGASCIGCHTSESPHQDQFQGTECSHCHAEDTWEEAPVFDHDDTPFKLIGKHLDVSCQSCHPAVRSTSGSEYIQYANLEFATCASCHEDVHEGSFGANCASCHTPADWSRLSKDLSASGFNHETTGFSLIGAHAEISCERCHARPARRDNEIHVTFIGNTSRNTYPRLRADNCLSCHVDYHRGELRDAPGGGALCENCHGQHDWFPTTYDITRHNRESSFALTGAHMATPCIGCHQQGAQLLTFTISDTACQDCHEKDNPHGAQFADARQATRCSTCHTTDSWQQASEGFDHDQTEFPLTGKHTGAPCGSCHTEGKRASGEAVQVFSGLETTCESCHSDDDPHQGQFVGTTCATCHTTDAFVVADFNHNNTRFPLTGAHEQVTCESCHVQETAPGLSPFTRFRPLPRKCEKCHGEE